MTKKIHPEKVHEKDKRLYKTVKSIVFGIDQVNWP